MFFEEINLYIVVYRGICRMNGLWEVEVEGSKNGEE